MRFTLRGARLVDATTDISGGDITIDGPRIQAVGQTHDAAEYVIDAADAIVVPGFIDVHTHGGGGFNLHTANAEEIHAYTNWVPTTGVTSFLIGVVGVPSAIPEEQLKAAVVAINDFAQKGISGATPLGIHLEGPYISLKRRGAHLPSWLRTPTEAETEYILDLTKGHLRLITLAPEL